MVANNLGAAASPTHSSVGYLNRLTNTVYLTVLISTSTIDREPVDWFYLTEAQGGAVGRNSLYALFAPDALER
jgi:hypothetical protein